MTLSQVKKYDFGSWKGQEYEGEPIPTFEEFISLCRDLGISPYVEIKNVYDSNKVKTLLDIVIKYGLVNKVSWISFNINNLQDILHLNRNARLGYVVNEINDSVCKQVSQININNNAFLDCNYKNVTSQAVQSCIDNSIPLEVWTVNAEEEIKNLNPYISGVTSDCLHAGRVLFDRSINVK